MMGRFKLMIISLWVLFLLTIFASLDLCDFYHSGNVAWKMLLLPNNIISIISLFALAFGAIYWYQFNHSLKGAPNGLPVKIISLENINNEYVSLLMILVSIVAFDFSSFRGAIIYIVVVFIFSVIFLKTNLFYSSPSLAIAGFHIYTVKTSNNTIIPDNSILVSKEILCEGRCIIYKKIAEKVFYCKLNKVL